MTLLLDLAMEDNGVELVYVCGEGIRYMPWRPQRPPKSMTASCISASASASVTAVVVTDVLIAHYTGHRTVPCSTVRYSKLEKSPAWLLARLDSFMLQDLPPPQSPASLSIWLHHFIITSFHTTLCLKHGIHGNPSDQKYWLVLPTSRAVITHPRNKILLSSPKVGPRAGPGTPIQFNGPELAAVAILTSSSLKAHAANPWKFARMTGR